MRSINPRFTYLLTYLLTYVTFTRIQHTADSDNTVEREALATSVDVLYLPNSSCSAVKSVSGIDPLVIRE